MPVREVDETQSGDRVSPSNLAAGAAMTKACWRAAMTKASKGLIFVARDDNSEPSQNIKAEVGVF